MTAEWHERLRTVGMLLLSLAAVGVAIGVGITVPDRPMLVLAGVVFAFVVVLALVNPVALPLAAMCLIVIVRRAGVGGLDMTISDWVLAFAFLPAVFFTIRPFNKPLRNILWANVVYQLATLFTLVANPFLANTIEWFHAWLLISGALIVGWAVGRAGQARTGLTIFVATCVLLAIPTLVQGGMQYLQGNFSAVYPRWPWPMHKNFMGNLLGVAAVLLYARPRWLDWSRAWTVPAFVLLLAAVGVTQSRQAIVGIMVGLLVISLRQHRDRRRAVLAAVIIAPMAYLGLTLIRDQIASGNEHNSWFQRLEWYTQSFEIWQESPWVGHGLRYWTQAGAPGLFQPPNAELEVLASAGLVGLLGFVAFWWAVAVVLWRMDPTYGTVALALALSRLAQSQLDLFWVSVSVSVPFLLVGVVLGAAGVPKPSVAETPARDQVIRA